MQLPACILRTSDESHVDLTPAALLHTLELALALAHDCS